MKKSFALSICLFLAITFCANVSAQEQKDILEQAAAKANRRTALRSLTLAKEYAAKKEWSPASTQAQFGLAYDETISDLWYINAIALNELGEPKAKVLETVEKALDCGDWVDYNKDGARILYADILSDTLNPQKAIEILDEQPVLFSADAEYIRTKSYYRLKDEASVEKARLKVDTARKMYPDDTRFPLLFYKNESQDDETPAVRKIAENLIAKQSLYAESKSADRLDLEIYSALFARGELQVRMLKSFAARNLEHPLYAVAALNADLMNQDTAFDYFTSFSDGSIDYVKLMQFVKACTDENVKNLLKIYLNSYGGILFYDTDGDGINNMYVKYYRGRPETISYDKNQDGIAEWRIVCDFGVPVNIIINEQKLSLSWTSFPYLSQAMYKNDSGERTLSFQLVDETLSWSPVSIDTDETVAECLNLKFYTPHLAENAAVLNTDEFAKAAFRYEIPSHERKNSSIKFTILDGEVQLARYYEQDKLYAQAQFENGVPTVRTVDVDGDGIFETTEIYGYDKENAMQVHTMEDEHAIMTNLFGLDPGSVGSGFYLHLIQIDSNADTLPEFTEEYLPFNGKITSWDLDSDSLWDIRYVRYPRATDADGNLEPLVEDSLFYAATQRNLVTVTTIDGIPAKVISKDEELEVTKDDSVDFYWIGRKGDSDFAQLARSQLIEKNTIGALTTVETDKASMLCVRVNENFFGILVEPFEEKE